MGALCVAGLAGLAATVVLRPGSAARQLPATSANALIAQVRASHPGGFSGTVVSTVASDLPGPAADLDGGVGSLTSLLSGTHTMQVWYGGAQQQRVALLGSTDETDVFRDGTAVWQWSSVERIAIRGPLPAATIASVTPGLLARQALRMVDATTSVRVEHQHAMADRSTYQLVLTPHSSATLIASVRIFVDGATKVPLGVRVYARGRSAPAIDVGFTSIRFARPSARNFSFTPPPAAIVRSAPLVAPVRIVGTGWSQVVVARPPAALLQAASVGGLISRATTVAGAWGSGRLLRAPLVSVLFDDDGRVLTGAVEPQALYAAAASSP